MSYVKLLFVILYYCALLLLCKKCSKRIFFTPEVCFVASFLPQLIYALFYVERWNLDLNITTLFVYMLGATVFVVTSLLFKSYFVRLNIKKVSLNETLFKIRLNSSFLLFFAIFQFISFYYVSLTVEQITERPNLSEAIDMFGFLSKGSGLEMPNLPGKMNMVCYSSSYLWAYYLCHAFVFRYKSNFILLFVNLLLSIIHHVLTGSRGGVVELIIASFFFLYLFKQIRTSFNVKMSLRSFVALILVGILGVVTFRFSLDLLGRNAISGEPITDYVARYLSAPLKNLDIKIQSDSFGESNVLEWKTISSLLAVIAKLIGFEYVRPVSDSSTYLSVNNFELGNVYTIYYTTLQDMNIVGPLLYIFIMALICSALFWSIIKNNTNANPCSTLQLRVVVYSFILTKIIFSFFGNKFYDNIMSSGLVWSVIFWFAVKKLSESRYRLKIN